jgi:hypothetical protein
VTEGIDIDVNALVCDDNEEGLCDDEWLDFEFIGAVADINQLLENRNTNKFVHRALPPPPEEQTPCNKFENVYEFVPSESIKPRFRECYEEIDSIYDNPADITESSSTNSSLSQNAHNDDYLEPIKTKGEQNDGFPDIIPTSALKKKDSGDDLLAQNGLKVSPHYIMPYVTLEVAFDMNRAVLNANDAYKKICALNVATLQQRAEEIFNQLVFPKAKFNERLKWRDFSLGANGMELSLGLLGFYKGRCYKVSHKECYLMVSFEWCSFTVHVFVFTIVRLFIFRFLANRCQKIC